MLSRIEKRIVEANAMKIKIKYHSDIPKLEKITQGDWIDLRAAADVIIHQGELETVPLGVSMELPAGYEAIIAPRSSLYKMTGCVMAGSIGVIDNSYCGDGDEWKAPLVCIRGRHEISGYAGMMERVAYIKKGDRICQFRIQKNQPEIEFEEVDTLGHADRGGIGSTGTQ